MGLGNDFELDMTTQIPTYGLVAVVTERRVPDCPGMATFNQFFVQPALYVDSVVSGGH